MYKANITLANGTTVTAEVQTVSELAALVASISGTKTETTAAKVVPVRHYKIIKRTGRKPKSGKRANYKRWTEADLIGAAKIIRDNVNVDQGLSTLVKAFIRRLGDDKKRPDSVIYTMTSDLRKYFRGNAEKVGKKNRMVLEGAGLLPSPDRKAQRITK